jgi:hypothetical protein
MTEQTSIDEYLNYLVLNGRRPSARTYGTMLRGFNSWLAAQGRDISNYLVTDVETYKRQLSMSSANTANTFIAAIRGYQRWRTGSLPLTSEMVIPETQRANQLQLVTRERPLPQYGKKTTTTAEVHELLVKMNRDHLDPVVYSGVVLHFYFGARAVELAHNLAFAKIDWDDRSMLLQTAKTKAMRYLAWHDDITPFLSTWYDEVPMHRPDYWLSARIRKYTISGLRVTSKFGRRTFETEERRLGVSQDLIDVILGHTNRRIGDVYMDWSSLQNDIRDVMENRHYMILNDIIP